MLIYPIKSFQLLRFHLIYIYNYNCKLKKDLKFNKNYVLVKDLTESNFFTPFITSWKTIKLWSEVTSLCLYLYSLKSFKPSNHFLLLSTLLSWKILWKYMTIFHLSFSFSWKRMKEIRDAWISMPEINFFFFILKFFCILYILYIFVNKLLFSAIASWKWIINFVIQNI